MKKIFDQIKSFPKWNWIWGSVVGLGILLRLRQYFVNRSLWVDEASLALNIVNRSFSELTLPLDYYQGAPIGFLFIEKILVLVFGNYDFILRLFPLFSGILSVYLMSRISNENFGKFGIIAALLFSVSFSMVYNSSELKQYASDTTVALLLTYFFLFYVKEQTTKTLILLGLAGVISIFISHPSAFILPVVGFLLVTEKVLKKTPISIIWIFGVGITWVGTFLATYFLSLRHLIGNETLQDYWGNYYAPMFPWEHLNWYKNAFLPLLPAVSVPFWGNVIPNFQPEYLINFCLTLVLIGIVSIFITDRKMALLIVAPILLALFASGLNKYPIYDRFIFFWLPSLLFLIAEGVRRIYLIVKELNPKFATFVYGVFSLVIIWAPITTSIGYALYPPMGENIKPVLAYIQKNINEEDIIYVHNGGITPFLYYEPFYDLNVKEIFVAEKSWNVKRFTIDVIDFQGTDRIWFVFSHIVNCDCQGNSREERLQAHIQILNKYGSQLDHFAAERADAYLYDLNP